MCVRRDDDDKGPEHPAVVGAKASRSRAAHESLHNRPVLSGFSTSAQADHIKTQLHPCAGGAYGSSALLTGPQTEGI